MATLFKVKVERARAEEASALLFEVGFDGLSEEAVGPKITLSAGGEDAADVADKQREFAALAARAGLPFQGTIETLSDDWKLSWIDALEPVQLTTSLRLVPREPPQERVPGELYLKPALAFGYGDHTTTRLASRWLEERVHGLRVLDVGSGTGVLSFVAAHCGASLALGIDIDLPSVQAATENATLNGFGGVCQFSAAQLSELDRNFDVLVANIDARTLAALAPELCARVSPGAPIALTGVLLEQAPAVQRAFEAQGCRLEQATSEDDWCLLSLAR